MKKFLSLTVIALIALIALTTSVSAADVTVNTEADLKDALLTDGTVKLSDDIEITESIRTSTNVTVDLNGFKITGPDDGKANWYAFIVEGGTFTLKDTSAAQTGEIDAKCYGIETKAGVFVMESGKITATKNATFGAAIVNYGGKVEIKGGTLVADVWAVDVETYFSNAELVISGGTFETITTKGAAVQIGGEYSKNGEIIAISGGTFKGTNAFAVISDASVSITGGTFGADVSEYVAPGYVINETNNLYEVKLNKPYASQNPVDSSESEFKMGVLSEVQGDVDKIFEKEIEKNATLKEALLDGKSVNIEVQMEKLEEKAIKEEELKAIKEAAKEGKFIEFYDITLAIIADEEEIDTIPEISNKLKFRVFIPEDLLKDGRTFFMYRYHDGKVEKLTGEVRELHDENYFIFESDKFSTYALAYEDKVEEPTAGEEGPAEQQPAKDETPKTGAFDIALYVLGAIALVSVVGTVKAKKPGKYSK